MRQRKIKTHLNNLSGKEWVQYTKSVWLDVDSFTDITKNNIENIIKSGVLISESPERDDLKKKHPATFSEKDVAKLIRFFTKQGETVLDPFLGSGSSAIASLSEGRCFIGIELYPEWLNIAKQRIEIFLSQITNFPYFELYCGDAFEIMQNFSPNYVDFIITSPPYWNILKKIDHKVKRERLSKGLETCYGNKAEDLSNIENYEAFLTALEKHFREYYRILKDRRYMAIVVSDFRHREEYYMFHSDVAQRMKRAGFTIQGLIILIQNNKKLYPYGYPTTFVPNISNQFIVIGRKL